MRICLLGYPEVEKGSYDTGVGRVEYTMAMWLRNNGHEVLFYQLFTREQYRSLNEFLLENGIDVAVWHMSTTKLKGKLTLPCPLISVWHNRPSYNFSPEKFCKRHKVPACIGKIIFLKPVSRFLNMILNCYNNAVYMYVTSCSRKFVLLSGGFIKEFLPAHFFRNRVTYIPNCLDCSVTDIPATEKENIVLFIGRLCRKKRVDRLLNAWKELEKAFPDWTLLIVGRGEESDSLQQLSCSLSLSRCNFEGWTSKPEEYYSKARISCLTSEYEGFGLTVIEGASYGVVPVVVDSFAAAEDIIEDGKNGILVPDNDGRALVGALSRLMSDSDLLQSLSECARNDVRKFSADTVMKQWEELLAETVTEA